MTKAEEERLRVRLSLALNLAGSAAQLFTMRDRALGLVLAKALSDITSVHWDTYKAMYDAMKG